jgi:hypothetical protein
MDGTQSIGWAKIAWTYGIHEFYQLQKKNSQ